MCVIWTFIYTSTILKLALHYYIATVATSYIVYTGACSRWQLFISICRPLLVWSVWTRFQRFSHRLPSHNRQIVSTWLHCLLDMCSLQKGFVFIQHVGGWQRLCVGFSTFQHIASLICNLSLIWRICTAERLLFTTITGVAAASAFISPLPADFTLTHFALLFIECGKLMTDHLAALLPSRPLGGPYLKICLSPCKLVEVNAGAHNPLCKSRLGEITRVR